MKPTVFMSFVEVYPYGTLYFVGNFFSRKAAWSAGNKYVCQHNFDAANIIVEPKKDVQPL